MDRLIAAAIGRSDRDAPVVTALGAIPGEVNGHIRSLTPSGGALNVLERQQRSRVGRGDKKELLITDAYQSG